MTRLTKDEIVAKLEAAKAAGMIRNVDYKDYSDRANRLLSSAYDYGRGIGERDMTGAGDAEYKLAYSFPSSVLHCSGYVKRASKYPRLAPAVELAAAWVVVEDLLKTVKPMIVKGRVIKEKTEAELAAEADEDARKRTCQICAMRFQVTEKARNMVLHGYQRPGVGYIIGDCYGHGHPPFEVSRDQLGKWIEIEKKKVADLQAVVLRLKAEPDEFTIIDLRGVEKTIRKGGEHYQSSLEYTIFGTESEIRQTENGIRFQQGRYDRWIKTE